VKANLSITGGVRDDVGGQHYYNAAHQSESLYALADIATAHGDRLAQDGVLAQPRYLKTVLTGDGGSVQVEIDPEASMTSGRVPRVRMNRFPDWRS
jgi:hypothetical protein